MRAHTLTLACILAAGLGAAPDTGRAQDMMTTCATDIGQFCRDVSNGRGRVLACLIAHGGKVSPACMADVTATAERGSGNPLVPSGVRKMLQGGGSAAVPEVCSADAASLCAGASPGAEHTLACLYARGDRVSDACSSGVRGALR